MFKMFEIKNDTIYLTRGDKATINLEIPDYVFKVGDTVKFKLYNEYELDKQAILTKIINIKTEVDNINIELTSEETKLGEMLNTAKIFWYEIELNDNQTILGYDEKGAKQFIIYPEGADFNE